MITQIEEKIVEKLKTAGLPVKDFDIKQGLRGLLFPSVFVATESGSFSRLTINKSKCEVKILVSVFFKHPKNEKERRAGINPILEGVINALFLETFTLQISPIVPKNFRNSTTQRLLDEGILFFQIELNTSFNFTKEEETEGELLKIGLDYYLQNTGKDNEVAQSDVVTLQETI